MGESIPGFVHCKEVLDVIFNLGIDELQDYYFLKSLLTP